MLRDFPLLLECIYTRQVLQVMNVEHRHFSKDYEKSEAALAQFATSILQGIQLGTVRGGRRHRKPRNGETTVPLPSPWLQIMDFLPQWRQSRANNDGNEI